MRFDVFEKKGDNLFPIKLDIEASDPLAALVEALPPQLEYHGAKWVSDDIFAARVSFLDKKRIVVVSVPHREVR